MTDIKGKTEVINLPAPQLFNAFADMRNFVRNLPEDKQDQVQATEYTLQAKVQGFNLGAQICSRMPYSYVQMKELDASPFKFIVEAFMNPIDLQRTEYHLEIHADLPFMIKMMLGGKLQTLVDTITEKLKDASEGKINPSDINIDELKAKMNI